MFVVPTLNLARFHAPGRSGRTKWKHCEKYLPGLNGPHKKKSCSSPSKYQTQTTVYVNTGIRVLQYKENKWTLTAESDVRENKELSVGYFLKMSACHFIDQSINSYTMNKNIYESVWVFFKEKVPIKHASNEWNRIKKIIIYCLVSRSAG